MMNRDKIDIDMLLLKAELENDFEERAWLDYHKMYDDKKKLFNKHSGAGAKKK